MSNGQNFHFVDVIKQECEDENHDVENIIQQDFQVKQEPGEEWNEQNFNFDDFIQKYSVSTEPPIHMFHARVVVERLPESILEKYVTVNQKPKVTKIKKKIKRIAKRKFLGTYQKFCPKCNERTSIEEKRTPKICSQCSIRLKFECRKCKKQLTDFVSIKIHVIVYCNPTGEYYKCLKCKYVSMTKNDVELHLKKYHRIRDPTNSMELRQTSIVYRGGRKRTSRPPHECSSCQQQFRSLSELLWHMQSCVNSKKDVDLREELDQLCTYLCISCNYTITKFESEVDRMRKHCNQCGLALARNCNVCQKVYTTGHGFQLHFKNYHGQTHRGTLICPQCDFSSSRLDNLSTHYKNHHLINAPMCEKCGKYYTSVPSLKAHMFICGNETKLQCEHCPFRTKFRNCLMKHLNTVHIIENPIDCSACKRKYKNQRSFNDHFRYCGVKPYLQCSKCPYKTSYKSALVRHSYTNHPDNSITKGFECSLCGKVFQNDSHRKSHEYTHRKRRMSCNDCFYTSLRWSDLIKHMKTMHLFKKGPNSAVCRDCGVIVQSQYYLKIHPRYCLAKPYFHCDHCIYKTQKKREIIAHLSWMHSKIYGSETVSNLDSKIDVTN